MSGDGTPRWRRRKRPKGQNTDRQAFARDLLVAEQAWVDVLARVAARSTDPEVLGGIEVLRRAASVETVRIGEALINGDL